MKELIEKIKDLGLRIEDLKSKIDLNNEIIIPQDNVYVYEANGNLMPGWNSPHAVSFSGAVLGGH